jgi:hypothetical protein
MQASDCDAPLDGVGTCNKPESCQGYREGVVCSPEHRCQPGGAQEDDTACTADVEVDGCGPYVSIHCDGTAKQSAPVCPRTCASDDACDSNAHCQDEVCVPDLADGRACGSDSQCTSGHCANGRCCKSGVCCATASECDIAQFGAAMACETPRTCQGMRGIPSCEQHQCTTTRVADDRACDLEVVANACDNGAPVKCMGGREQLGSAACANGTCLQSFDCPRSAHCQMGACVPDAANGERCNSADMCQSGHCEDNECCSYTCCDPHLCPGAPCADVMCPSQ